MPATREHRYAVEVTWTGNLGQGTAHYRAYSRNHEIGREGKLGGIAGSSDPAFRGDPARYNPEELLLAAASACHMLWMLHLCADAGIVVTDYADVATGTMVEHAGSGEFSEIVLRPRIAITDIARAAEVDGLHASAGRLCAIARSLRCPVRVAGTVAGGSPAAASGS